MVVLIGPMAAGLTLEAQARALTMANSHDTGPGSSRQTISPSLTYPVTTTRSTGELVIAKPLNHSRPGASRIIREGASVAALWNLAAW